MPRIKKVSDEIVLESYMRLGNVWKVADELGMKGQTVHNRVTRLGVAKKRKKICDIEELKSKYDEYCNSGMLQDLADYYGTTKQNLCKAARKYGLTNIKRASTESEIEKLRSRKKKYGEDASNWKGGVRDSGACLFDTYSRHVDYADEVRRDPCDPDFLQVKCTYCGKWYRPLRNQIGARRFALTKGNGRENRLYCSDECKKQCPVFKKHKHVLPSRSATSREVQPTLRKIVFERDGWACQKCGELCGLQCHHFEGIRQNPIESADADMCITLCSGCHRLVHKEKGCRPQDFMCKEPAGHLHQHQAANRA